MPLRYVQRLRKDCGWSTEMTVSVFLKNRLSEQDAFQESSVVQLHFLPHICNLLQANKPMILAFLLGSQRCEDFRYLYVNAKKTVMNAKPIGLYFGHSGGILPDGASSRRRRVRGNSESEKAAPALRRTRELPFLSRA